MKLAAGDQDAQQLIEALTALEMKNELNKDELIVTTSLYAVLEECHGQIEVEHIETIIKNKIDA